MTERQKQTMNRDDDDRPPFDPEREDPGTRALRELFEQIEVRFTYHPPRTGQPERYEKIRDEAKRLAYTLARECPVSRELSTALTRLDEVVMHANAAIARNA